MKQVKLSIFLTMLLCMFGANAYAHDIEVKNDDGVTIYYIWNNDKTELIVSFKDNNPDGNHRNYKDNIIIPENVLYNGNTYRVTSIGQGAFSGCSSLTSITIPNSVTTIFL